MEKTVLIFSNDPMHAILYAEELNGKFKTGVGDINNPDFKGIDLVILNTRLNKLNQFDGIDLGEKIKKNYPKISIIWLTTDIASLNGNKEQKERCLKISRFLLSVPCFKQTEKMLNLISEALEDKKLN